MSMISCYECGKKISDTARACPNCGAAGKSRRNNSEKEGWMALLLAFLLGAFGAHRFYVGKTGTAITMLVLTLTIFGMLISGIWALIDMIIIICGNFTDAKGKKLKF